MLIGATANALVLLAVLACPVGMGLMMLFMGRGMKHGEGGRREQSDSSLAEMKAEQARLAEKIAALQADKAKPHGHEPTSDREPDPVT